MPATAICWSTYEFAKFILSRQSREDYHSSTSSGSPKLLPAAVQPHLRHHPKDVLASAADKVRLDDAIRIGYVLPSTRASPPDADDVHLGKGNDNDNDSDSSSSSNNGATSSSSNSAASSHNHGNNSTGTGSLLPRELPSMSGAGVYSSALSLNTIHTQEPAGAGACRRAGLGFAESRGCST